MITYLNGSQYDIDVNNSVQMLGGPTPQFNGYRISNTPVQSYNGSMDQPKVFNRTLSPEQIAAIYNSELNGNAWDTLVSSETTLGENWTVVVTPTSSVGAGTSLTSNGLVISNPLDGVGHPSNKSFIISNLSGSTVAMFDDKGDSYFSGTVTQSGTNLNPPSKSFIIKNSTGAVISYVNNTGYLFLKGSIFTSSNLTGLTSGNLEFRNSTGSLVSFFDNQGNLKLKGGYVESYNFSGGEEII